MLDFTGTATWNNITSWLPWSDWAKLPAMGVRLELSVPLIPADGSTLAQCAAGAYNAHWTTLAQNLVTYGLADTVVRLGWEFNGGWFPWNARDGKAADYAGAFRQAVTAMRAVTGQAFLFDWCVANGINHQLFEDGAVDVVYPGDAYVDVIGVDVYDELGPYYPLPTDPAAAYTAHMNTWRNLYGGPFQVTATPNVTANAFGLRYWAAFAKQHGKLLAVDEWGLVQRGDGAGGNDDPAFVDQMFNYMAANDVAWSNYFAIDTPGRKHVLFSPTTATVLPESAARYLARVGELGRGQA